MKISLTGFASLTAAPGAPASSRAVIWIFHVPQHQNPAQFRAARHR